jgi:hypothetical protein
VSEIKILTLTDDRWLNVNFMSRPVRNTHVENISNLSGQEYRYSTYIYVDDMNGFYGDSSLNKYVLPRRSETNHILVTGHVDCYDSCLEGQGWLLMLDPDQNVYAKPFDERRQVHRYGKDFFVSFISGKSGLRVLEYCKPSFLEGMEITAVSIGQRLIGNRPIPQAYWDKRQELLDAS